VLTHDMIYAHKLTVRQPHVAKAKN